MYEMVCCSVLVHFASFSIAEVSDNKLSKMNASQIAVHSSVKRKRNSGRMEVKFISHTCSPSRDHLFIFVASLSCCYCFRSELLAVKNRSSFAAFVKNGHKLRLGLELLKLLSAMVAADKIV